MKLLSQKTENDLKLFFSGFKNGFLDFSELIARIVNSLLLSLVYFIGVGLTSIFAKIARKHFLETNSFKKKNTYWSDLDLKKRDIEEYYRQF